MRWYGSIAAAAVVGVLGCGTEDDRVALAPATGTVTLNGKPLANATVTFLPAATNKVSTPGVDSTGPEGNYRVMWKHRSGVAPGKYTVVVTPPEPAPTAASEAFKDDPYMAKLANEAAGGARKKEVAGEKTEFDVEVPPNGDVFDFDVKAASSKK